MSELPSIRRQWFADVKAAQFLASDRMIVTFAVGTHALSERQPGYGIPKYSMPRWDRAASHAFGPAQCVRSAINPFDAHFGMPLVIARFLLNFCALRLQYVTSPERDVFGGCYRRRLSGNWP